jgi:[acyl-carrier-protein] S-malonyltransferase
VRWIDTIQAFAAQGVTHIVECGPGKVLTGLGKRIAPDIEALPLNDADAIAAAVAATREGA